jgi:hypothetical protein
MNIDYTEINVDGFWFALADDTNDYFLLDIDPTDYDNIHAVDAKTKLNMVLSIPNNKDFVDAVVKGIITVEDLAKRIEEYNGYSTCAVHSSTSSLGKIQMTVTTYLGFAGAKPDVFLRHMLNL